MEYQLDSETDMFQIGRSSETPIDFVVMDTIPGDKHGEMKVCGGGVGDGGVSKYSHSPRLEL